MKEKWAVREVEGDLSWPSKPQYQSLKKYDDLQYEEVDHSERGEQGMQRL